MSIRVAPELLGRVFFVPKSIVDEHLVQDLAGGLAMSAADVSDALQYWFTTGVLVRDAAPEGVAVQPTTPPAATGPVPYTRGSTAGAGTTSPAPAPAQRTAPQQPLLDVPDIVPTYETVAARLLEDPALKAMFQEVQALMGKTIGYDTQAKFIMMHDTYGLPPEVILTIVDYSVKKGKGIGYMCKVGKNWAEEGVTPSSRASSPRTRRKPRTTVSRTSASGGSPSASRANSSTTHTRPWSRPSTRSTSTIWTRS